MAMKKNAGELAAELCADLNALVDVEELARATGLNPNTIYCHGYKNKGQSPNLVQLIKELDRAQEINPAAVAKFCKRFTARYGLWTEAVEVLAEEVRRRG